MTGPWVVERQDDQWVVTRGGSALVFLWRDTEALAQKACDEANERHRLNLIREAAPELLAALKDALELVESVWGEHFDPDNAEAMDCAELCPASDCQKMGCITDKIRCARDAISKATGSAS